MKEAILEGVMIGAIALLVVFALSVWGVVIASVLEGYPLAQAAIICLLTIAIPVTLNVIQYKQNEKLAEQPLSNKG